MSTLLSVIIPIYNVEKYVRQCIESVICQNYKDLEIILVDDGSTDGCCEIVDQYEKLDIRVVVIHKANGGLLSARTAGVEVAHAKYIIFVDGDDWISPYMYENLMGKMLNAKIWITSGCYSVDQDRFTKYYDKLIPEGFYNKERMEKEIYPIMMHDERVGSYALDPSTCFKIYKKEILLPILQKLKNYKFYYGEDSAISYLYALEANSMLCTHEPFYYHRKRPHNVIPSYIDDEKYFEKLLEFYNFMKCEIQNSKYYNLLSGQLDLFVAKSANYKRMKYQLPINGRKNYFLFPFDLLSHNTKIILYGAGTVGQDYQKQLSKSDGWELVAWVDRNFEGLNENIQNPEIIKKLEFDYIIIAIANDEVSTSVKMWLLGQGVPENKVIHKISRCSV